MLGVLRASALSHGPHKLHVLLDNPIYSHGFNHRVCWRFQVLSLTWTCSHPHMCEPSGMAYSAYPRPKSTLASKNVPYLYTTSPWWPHDPLTLETRNHPIDSPYPFSTRSPTSVEVASKIFLGHFLLSTLLPSGPSSSFSWVFQ